MEESLDRKRKIDETGDPDLADGDKKRHLSNIDDEVGSDQNQTEQSNETIAQAVAAPSPPNVPLAATEGEEEAHIPEENGNEVDEQEYSRQDPTNIPYDRLIVLEFEATCDDNPSNPASVQVTKVLI